MRRFQPGMTCPGVLGRACNATLDTRADCYTNRIVCYHCGRAEQTELQRIHREKHWHPCKDCGATCGRAAERCRKCGQKWAKAEKVRLDRERAAAPKVPTPYFVPAGRWEDWAADRALYDPAKARVVDACQR